jgi:PST family polysaccharide transporter
VKSFVLSLRTDRSRRALAENFFSLTLLQYGNYIFPLITLPYLARVIGVEHYGQIAFAQAFIAYFAGLVNYGFGFSATRQVAAEQDDPSKLRIIFSQVIWAKVVLATLSFILMISFVELQPQRRPQLLLYLACYTTVIGSVLAPEWFFQGIEKMKYITILSLVSRTVATIMIFTLVRRVGDYIKVPLLNGLGVIGGACIGHWLICAKLKVTVDRPSVRGVITQLRDGWDNFLSSVFISLYTTSNAFVLGLMTNATEVGYYAAAERISYSIRSLWGPVPQVLYPRFVRTFALNPIRGRRNLRLVLIVTACATLLLSFAGCLAAPFIVRHYLGAKFEPSIPIVQILIFNVFAIGMNNVLGVQGLLANRMNATFRNIVMGSGILNLALLIPFVRHYGASGPAISVLIVEFSIVVAMGMALRRKSLI